MTINEVKELCIKLYPQKCKECPFHKECEDMDKKGIEHVLPKDWEWE